MEDLMSVKPSSSPLCCPVYGQSTTGCCVAPWVPLGWGEHCQGAVHGASLHYLEICKPFFLPFSHLLFHVIIWFLLLGPSFSGRAFSFLRVMHQYLLSLNERTIHGSALFSLFHPLAGCSSGTYEKDVVSMSLVPVSLIFPPPVDSSIRFLVSVSIVSTRDVQCSTVHLVRNTFGFSACSMSISVAALPLEESFIFTFSVLLMTHFSIISFPSPLLHTHPFLVIKHLPHKKFLFV